jgi:hypothetical protein
MANFLAEVSLSYCVDSADLEPVEYSWSEILCHKEVMVI